MWLERVAIKPYLCVKYSAKTLAAFRENLQGASIALEWLDLRWLSLLAG